MPQDKDSDKGVDMPELLLESNAQHYFQRTVELMPDIYNKDFVVQIKSQI